MKKVLTLHLGSSYLDIMRNNLLFILLLICCVSIAQAQDSIGATMQNGLHIVQNENCWGTYKAERGFFQKAYSDPSNPRFMMTNEDETFSFGIGGVVHFTTFEDFNGSVNATGFSTFDIASPTRYANHFGMSMTNSKINFKASSKLGNHNLIAFCELSAIGDNGIELKKVYVSYDGLSVGKTYSFFMDLAAGVQTVDLQGPNTQIDNVHPLIGYTLPIGNRWEVAMAAEISKSPISDIYEQYVNVEFQSMPDFTAHIKLHDDWGHLQLSGVYRRLHYRSVNLQVVGNDASSNEIGFGAALSGKVNLGSRTFVTFQGVYGRGIAQYIADLAGAEVDLVAQSWTDDNIYKATFDPGWANNLDQKVPFGCTQLTTLPVYGGYFSVQHQFNQKFFASITYGCVATSSRGSVYDQYSLYLTTVPTYKSSQYVAANLFYNIDQYTMVGIEYLYGERHNYASLTDPSPQGHANRIDAMLIYTF
ncbi:MAG: porin [Bacteroidales bacterium]|nr:porin [Candidatus Colimorpha onthohippi]